MRLLSLRTVPWVLGSALAAAFVGELGCALIAGVEEGTLAPATGTTSGTGGAGGTATGSGGGNGGTGGTTTGSTGGTGGLGAAGTGGGSSTGGSGGGTPSGSPTTDPYYEAVMADDPVAYFRFAETTGLACANEVSGSSYSATYPTGNATRGVTGIRPDNDAIRFDDGAAQISVFGNMDFPGDVAFTIEFWIYVQDLANTGRFFGHTDGPPLHGTWLGKWNQNDWVRSETWDNGTIFFYTASQSVIPENTWLHIVLRHVVGDRDYLYVNGSEGEGYRVAAGDRTDVTSTFQFTGFVGVLDEFAVYDKALDTTRIAAHIVAQGQ